MIIHLLNVLQQMLQFSRSKYDDYSFFLLLIKITLSIKFKLELLFHHSILNRKKPLQTPPKCYQ